MDELAALPDAELARRIQWLRREQLRRADRTHACARCGKEFHARAGARYCSGACRVAAFRARTRATGSVSRRVKR